MIVSEQELSCQGALMSQRGNDQHFTEEESHEVFFEVLVLLLLGKDFKERQGAANPHHHFVLCPS